MIVVFHGMIINLDNLSFGVYRQSDNRYILRFRGTEHCIMMTESEFEALQSFISNIKDNMFISSKIVSDKKGSL